MKKLIFLLLLALPFFGFSQAAYLMEFTNPNGSKVVFNLNEVRSCVAEGTGSYLFTRTGSGKTQVQESPATIATNSCGNIVLFTVYSPANQFNDTKQMGVNPNYVVGVVSNTSGNGVLKMISPTENFTTTSTYNAAVALLSICVSGGGGGGSLTNTYVGFGDGLNQLDGEAGFTYDAEANRLAVDTVKTKRITAKVSPLEILGDITGLSYTSSRNDAGRPTSITTWGPNGEERRDGIYELKDSLGLAQPSGQVVYGTGNGIASDTGFLFNASTGLLKFTKRTGSTLGAEFRTDHTGRFMDFYETGNPAYSPSMYINDGLGFYTAKWMVISSTFENLGTPSYNILPADNVESMLSIHSDVEHGVQIRAGVGGTAVKPMLEMMDRNKNYTWRVMEDGKMQWGASTISAFDIGFSRLNSNELEINNGTNGTRRDLRLRDIFMNNDSRLYFKNAAGVDKGFIIPANDNSISLRNIGAGGLHFQSSGGDDVFGSVGDGGNFQLYDSKAATGISTLKIRAGAGQSANLLSDWANNANSTVASMTKEGEFTALRKISTGTDYDKLPTGTTAQRPASPTEGMLRGNSTLHKLDYYDGTTWQNPAFATQLKFPLKMTVVDGNTDVPGAGLQTYEVIRIPACYNGYSISDVSYGVWKTGATGTAEMQIRKNGSGTAGVTWTAGQGVKDVTLTGVTVSTGDLIDVEIISNSMATPQQGLWVTIFLTPH